MDAVSSTWAIIDEIVAARFPDTLRASLRHQVRVAKEQELRTDEKLLKPGVAAKSFAASGRLIIPKQTSMPPIPKAAQDQLSVQRQRQTAADELTDELMKLTHSELLREHRSAMAAKMLEEEKKLVFNGRWAAAGPARYARYLKMPYWTADEFTALALGKNPELVNWTTVKDHVAISPFAMRYSELRELLTRAIAAKQLFEQSPPALFVSWAIRYQVEIEEQLLAHAANDGLSLKHWHDVAQEEKNRADTLALENKKLMDRIVSLEQSRASPQPEKPQQEPRREHTSASTRKLKTVSKLLFGLCSYHYKVNFQSGKSPNVQPIISHLATAGVTVDDETLKRHLLAGSEAAAENR